ncbi:hypothetical protein SLA2020_048310 [Shorea laevis]
MEHLARSLDFSTIVECAFASFLYTRLRVIKGGKVMEHLARLWTLVGLDFDSDQAQNNFGLELRLIWNSMGNQGPLEFMNKV